MDGIHDLGGKQGYGPVDVNEPDAPFHADYEGRMWAMSRTAKAPNITIDWWRHIRELVDRDDYLERSYFDSWAQTHMASMIDAGVFTFAELASGKSETAPLAQVETTDHEGVLALNKTMAFRFDAPVKSKPAFNQGQTVLTNSKGHEGHTRLPEYARNKSGVILSYRGAHIFADDSAKGNEWAQHLYTVSFQATELWGDKANPKDSVSLELWEDYLNAS